MAAYGSRDVIERAIRVALYQCRTAHYDSRGTKTALEGVMLHKGLLHRMEFPLPGEAFNRSNVLPPHIQSKRHATRSDLAVDPDGACGARPAIASNFGTGESKTVTEKLDQGSRWIHA